MSSERVFVFPFTERRRLQRRICSSSIPMTADWQVGWRSCPISDLASVRYCVYIYIIFNYILLECLFTASKWICWNVMCLFKCFLWSLFPPSEGPRLFCRSSHLEEQREEWEERRSALRQVNIRLSKTASPCLRVINQVKIFVQYKNRLTIGRSSWKTVYCFNLTLTTFWVFKLYMQT